MFKKIMLLSSLSVVSCCGTSSYQVDPYQPPVHQQKISIETPQEEEFIFEDIDQPEIIFEDVPGQKPSALFKFLAKGYPILVWCVQKKRLMVTRLIAFKDGIKNWFFDLYHS